VTTKKEKAPVANEEIQYLVSSSWGGRLLIGPLMMIAGGKVKKTMLRVILAGMTMTVIGSMSLAQCPKGQSNCLDLSNYPQTITITVSRVEDVVTGSSADIRTKQPLYPGPLNQPKTVVKQQDTHETCYIVVGVIDGVQYTLQSNPGALLGTYKARITNSQYIDILIVEPSGRSYNVGTKILEQEKLSVAAPDKPSNAGNAEPTQLSPEEAMRFVRDYCKNAKTVEELNACRGL
jgi:hypothetical protein